MIRRAEKTYIPDDITFRTKPRIALDLVRRAKANDIRVMAWTADELYGGNREFLDGLDARGEALVIEIPRGFHVWMVKPEVQKTPPEIERIAGRPRTYPRLKRGQRS